MSLLKFYGHLTLVPLAVAVVVLPYHLWKSYKYKTVAWDPKAVLPNFNLLCQAKTHELRDRICPAQFRNLVPYVHQGNLNYNTKKEADEAIHTLVEMTSVAVGACAALIPVARFFSDCLPREGISTCTSEAANDLLSFAGIPLITGAWLVSRIAKYVIINPVSWMLTHDQFQEARVQMLTVEYTKITKALNEVLDRSTDDQIFIEMAARSKQFLRLAPHIENEIHTSLALDRSEAKEFLIPLRMVCQQIVAKQARSPAPPPKPKEEAQEKPTAQPNEAPIPVFAGKSVI